jgi:hypothetical protein
MESYKCQQSAISPSTLGHGKDQAPFEWNSLASACPMPPGEHLQPRVSTLLFPGIQ